MRRLMRFLKLAFSLDKNNDDLNLQRLCVQFDAFIKKHGHYEPKNDGTTPNPWRRNMDYSGWDNSPYFGSVSEFMKKFPGGIKDWIEWRRKNQKERFQKWDPKKKAAERIKIAGKKRKAIYTAVFLTPESKDSLATWWKENVGELLPKHFMHHMTIKFKPSVEEVLALPISREVTLSITGYGKDEKAQAVRVSGIYSDNPIPHITVATDGTSPVYSNELLAAHVESAPGLPPTLVGNIGIFDGSEPKFDLSETIYEETQQEPSSGQESEANDPKIDYLGEEVTEEEREKAFDLIAKQIEMYKEMLGLTDEEIKEWIESKYGKMSIAHFVDVKEDKTKDFPKELHLWSGGGSGLFKSILQFLKKYRSQDAKDDNEASKKAVEDFINYWKLLRRKGK
jgi:hypothetical protein